MTMIAQKKSFTLIEIIMAASLFAAISVLGAVIFINVIKAQKQLTLENAIYEDARFMMERIAREIRQNTVDYEEYYNRLIGGTVHYGERQGCYASRFYNPGKGPGGLVRQLGVFCTKLPQNYQVMPTPLTGFVTEAGCVVDKETYDTDTGQNPYAGSPIDYTYKNQAQANAFCDMNYDASSPNCADASKPASIIPAWRAVHT